MWVQLVSNVLPASLCSSDNCWEACAHLLPTRACMPVVFADAFAWQGSGKQQECVCVCLQLQLQEFVQSRKFGQVGRGWSYLSVAQKKKKKLAQAEQTHSHISCASILFLLRILLSLQFKKISACIVISRNRKLACRYQT